MYFHVSFNLRKNQVEELMILLPSKKASRIIRKYINHDYVLPGKDTLKILVEMDFESRIYPFTFDQDTLNNLDSLVGQAEIVLDRKFRSRGNTGGRSFIMRDVLDQIIEIYKESPLPEVTYKRRSFRILRGVKKDLKQYIPVKFRAEEIIDFVLDEYRPSSNKVEFYKRQLIGEQDKLYIDAPQDFYDKLENLVKEIDKDGINVSTLFRDAVEQLLLKLKDEENKRE